MTTQALAGSLFEPSLEPVHHVFVCSISDSNNQARLVSDRTGHYSIATMMCIAIDAEMCKL